jgi:hypothetical protein
MTDYAATSRPKRYGNGSFRASYLLSRRSVDTPHHGCVYSPQRDDEEEYAAIVRVREGRLRVKTSLDGEAEYRLGTAA